MLVKKKLTEKNLGKKKNWPKFFLGKTNLGQKKIWRKKKFGSKNKFGSNFFFA